MVTLVSLPFFSTNTDCWDRHEHKATKDEYGTWTVHIPNKPDGSCPIPHMSTVKVALRTAAGEEVDRLPQYTFACHQASGNPMLDSVFWHPPSPYVMTHPRPARPTSLKIYEAHVGMATDKERVGTYREFADDVLPYVAELGYNAVQLMALAEHSYYGCFGYQVTSFFAPSSRSGTPDDLKYLIDKAHSLGIAVLMDLVHSHASKNVVDGINGWDGSDHHLFHAPPRGDHPAWDSRLFNYENMETLRFLLSNLAYWQNEYLFDGFRFDGITSMIYLHHGVGVGFSGAYHEYFGPTVDASTLVYLMLANNLIHAAHPDAITIAEDVSGMPTMCNTVPDGGLGFDYRMAMAVPDMWVKLLKEVRDEDWDVAEIAYQLINRRWQERYVGYSECHDQAIVGDKTIAFRLMDSDMYTRMSILQQPNPVIERGIALHKVIRLLTLGLSGEAYLTFMGNEFGHPEWIDFPREGNGWSYKYCRRQWGLARDPLLRYQHLFRFEKAMIALENRTHWLTKREYITLTDNENKVLAWIRHGLVFAINLHPTKALTAFPIPVFSPGTYRVALDTDTLETGGQGRLDTNVRYFTQPAPAEGGRPGHTFSVYLPPRVGIVWKME